MNNTVTVTINDEEVKGIAQGMPIIDCLDETLDSSTLLIAPSTRKARFPIFGKVVITINGHVKYFYISEDDVDVICKSPILYSHTVSLIEPTKILERIPCDNLTFTQPAAQNAYPTQLANGEASIYDVIMRIRECCQLRRMDDPRPYPFEITNAAFIAYLKGIKAPQFFLNMGNVKDALNQVFKYLNAISRLENFTELTADFFNKYNELLSEEGILDEGQSQNIEDYATSLLSNISNAIADNDDPASVIVYPSDTDWASMRTKESAILDSNNASAILESKIYKINNLWLYVEISGVNIAKTPNILFNCAQFLVEKSVYETLPTRSTWNKNKYEVGARDYYSWDLSILGKDAALYYEYLGDEIKGFGNGTKTSLFGTSYTINILLSYYYAKQHDGLRDDQTDGASAMPNGINLKENKFENILWRCEYVSTTDTRIAVQKIDLSDYNTPSVQQINQASNLVNIKAYGDNMSGLLQRMGNAEKIRTKLFKHYEDCPKVGDYTEDGYVVTTTQKAIYNDFVSCSIALTKNFNRKSQFVDVASEVRQFVIPAAGQSLVRQCNFEEYIYLDTGNNYQAEETLLNSTNHLSAIFNANNKSNSPKMALLTFIDANDVERKILKSVDTKGVANTIVFTISFTDNRGAGNSTSEKYKDGTKIVQQPILYSDELGSCYRLKIDVASQIYLATENFETNFMCARGLPEALTNLSALWPSGFFNQSIIFNLLKDPSEILKITIQEHILPIPQNKDKMIIGRGFTLENPLVMNDRRTRRIGVYIIPDKFSRNENLHIRGELFAEVTNTLTEILPTIPIGVSWCVGNMDSKSLYLAYNPDATEEPLSKIRFIRRISRI